LIAEKITAKKAKLDKIEMVDQATGEIYCTWIENGEWQKVKGECGSSEGCQPQTFYLDSDGDSYGDPNNSTSTCEAPADSVLDNTDCDDNNSNVNPGATEICDDNIDNDCDSKIDTEDEDCQAASPAALACDSEYLDLCTTQELCEGISLYWYNDVCNLEPQAMPDVCDATHLNLCSTEADCETAGGYWYNETCNTEPEPELEPCTPNWSCSDWQPAPETIACGQTFTQTRTCTDLNSCGTEEGKPIESQDTTGDLCLSQNATGICQSGACNFTCADGYYDCDDSPGCEATSTCEK